MLFGKKELVIGSPVKGQAVSIQEVNDPTFAEDILGKGVAVKPTLGRVVAPADAVLSQMFETGHACNMVTTDGAELLIHIGIDTIKLKGKYFTIHAQSGADIKKGDLLIEFDIDGITAEGYDVITPVVLLNPGDFKQVHFVQDEPVGELDALIKLKK